MGSFNCIFENNSLKALFGQNIKKLKILKLSPDSRYLQKLALNMSRLVGQEYDGASVMSSGWNGVQAKFAETYPNAMYIHCRSHVLNLAILRSCKALRSIQNLFDNVSKLMWFLSGSAKSKEIFLQTAAASDDSELLSALVACADEDKEDESAKTLEEGSKRQTVPKFCGTRWSAKVTSLSALLAKYGSVLLALDEISFKPISVQSNEGFQPIFETIHTKC